MAPVRMQMGTLRRVVALGLVLVLMTGCAWGRLKQPGERPQPATDPPPAMDRQALLDRWINHLTLEEKVGQLFWTGLPGPELTDAMAQLIARGRVGGLVFFSRQGSDPDQLRALTDAIQRAAQAGGRPLPGVAIAVDQEGGLVQRFGAPFTSWPGNMALGAAGSEALARDVAAAMGRELRVVGIHINLAPVADVNNNPANPVIGVRSFGESPELVEQMVAAFIEGLHAEGVGAVAKHFPGHGDTDRDSHLALPRVPHPRERLEQVELRPFRVAIAAGVDLIMTAHVSFPAIAPDGRPATLSREVLTGLLREELGFQGVIVTDALDGMKAITDHYGLEGGLVLTLKAGADVALVPDSYDRLETLHNLVLQAVEREEIPEDQLEASVRRNLELKERLGLLPPLDGAGGSGPAGKTGAPRAVGAADHQALARVAGAAALTLVRNKHLPLRLAPDQPVLVVAPAYAEKAPGQERASSALAAGIRAHHAAVREVLLPSDPSEAETEAVRQAAQEAAVIVYAVRNGHRYEGHQRLIGGLVASGKAVILVGLGEPYELTRLPEVETYVAAYGYREPNLHGVGALLFGKAEPQGRLPVSIPGLYPAGHGLSY